MPDAGLSKVTHEDRRTLFFRHHRIGDVVEVLHQPHTAHVETLRAHREVVAAHVGIALGERVDDLIERDVVAEQTAGIEVDVKLFGCSA